MVSVRAASVVSLKFVEEVQTMAGLRLKSNSNPPVSPFSKLIVTHNLGYWTRGVRADVEQS
jgi:hypothetical protein